MKMADSAENHSIVHTVIIAVFMLAVIWTVDHYTLPFIDLSIAYFLPVAYTAWYLGRWSSIICAFIADVPALIDQDLLFYIRNQPAEVVVLNLILRFLVFVFVAEIMFRLARHSRKLTEDARRLNELNGRLESANDELKIIYNNLDEDLRTAGALQERLLSFPNPDVSGIEIGSVVRYASATGGDYADAGFKDDKIYFCVADISGKGTPAALFTLLLEHLLKDAVSRRLEPVAIVRELNDGISQRFPVDKFVTLFYAELDPAAGIVEYVNAGHVEGVIYRTAAQKSEKTQVNCHLLGPWNLPEDTRSSILQLNHSDILAVFSDGMVESRLLSTGRLGEDFMLKMVRENADQSAQEIVNKMISEADMITDPAFRDDMTIICIKRL